MHSTSKEKKTGLLYQYINKQLHKVQIEKAHEIESCNKSKKNRFSFPSSLISIAGTIIEPKTSALALILSLYTTYKVGLISFYTEKKK